MRNPIKIGILGLGRIGQLHARNLAVLPDFSIVAGVDPYLTQEKEQVAREIGIPVIGTDPEIIFSNPEVEAVAILSTTETHSDFIIRAAKAGKAIFCEKPIDHDVERILEALRVVRENNAVLQVGFSHRFDRHHARVGAMVADGIVGDVNFVRIISRDPTPPSYEYIASSGGIFVDMMIHDFDMARFLSGSEVVEVSAAGAVLCDEMFARANDVDTAVVTLRFANGALGVIDNSRRSGFGHDQRVEVAVLCDEMFARANDVDTAVVTLRFANGALGVIDNSRRSGFGHDQRVEVMGSKGCLMDQNVSNTNVLYLNEQGIVAEPVQYFFLERYNSAFVEEMRQFAQVVRGERDSPVTGLLYLNEQGIVAEPVQYFFLERYNSAFVEEMRQFAQVVRGERDSPVTGFDGLQAVLIAEAAARSWNSGKFEKVEQIGM